MKALKTQLNIEQHNLYALYPDEIPECLIQHIRTANLNLLIPFNPNEILIITRAITHFAHDMTAAKRPLRQPLCLYLKEYILATEDPADILNYMRL